MMTLNENLRREALELTAKDKATPRTAVDEDRLMDGFVAESESLEGHDSKPAEVLNSARDLALA